MSYKYKASRQLLDKEAVRPFEIKAVTSGLTDFGPYYAPDDAPQGKVLAAYTREDAVDGIIDIDVFFTAIDRNAGIMVTEVIIQVEDGIFRSAGVLWGDSFNILKKVVNKRHVLEANGFDGDVTHYVYDGNYYSPVDYANLDLKTQRSMAAAQLSNAA